ncbi:hypothetical protein [Candidatus Allofournierella excrementavium]|uniref:hypothetical protein n=1 Tax=Candidatus Allofournierella excrementavium TaxID=2838591 RepID=UPI003AB79BCC
MRGAGSLKRGAQQAGTARYGIIISAAGHKPVTKKSRAAARDVKKIGFKGENRNESYLEAKKRVFFYNFRQITNQKISSLPTL